MVWFPLWCLLVGMAWWAHEANPRTWPGELLCGLTMLGGLFATIAYSVYLIGRIP